MKRGASLRLELQLLSRWDIHLILPLGVCRGLVGGEDTAETGSSIKHRQLKRERKYSLNLQIGSRKANYQTRRQSEGKPSKNTE